MKEICISMGEHKSFKIKPSFILALLLLLTSHGARADTPKYNIELIIFKQSAQLGSISNTSKSYALPNINLKNAQFHYLTTDNDEQTKDLPAAKLNQSVTWLLNNSYTVLYHSIIEATPNYQNRLNIYTTNQQSIIDAIEDKTFNRLDYYSRQYFMDSEIAPLMGQINLKVLNDNTLRANFQLNYIHEGRTFHEILVQERRKLRLDELNYFDNPEIGVLLMVSKIDGKSTSKNVATTVPTIFQ